MSHKIIVMNDGIRILREPAVYLVGRQTATRAEIDRFLADHQVSAGRERHRGRRRYLSRSPVHLLHVVRQKRPGSGRRTSATSSKSATVPSSKRRLELRFTGMPVIAP